MPLGKRKGLLFIFTTGAYLELGEDFVDALVVIRFVHLAQPRRARWQRTIRKQVVEKLHPSLHFAQKLPLAPVREARLLLLQLISQLNKRLNH